MDFRTLEAIVQDVIVDLSMAPGTGTQRYTEDIVALRVKDAYRLLSRERWWKPQMEWETIALDGVTGLPTTTMPFETFQDVSYVLYNTNPRPLSMLPREFNPFRLDGGTTPRYIEPYYNAGKLFRVWPRTSIGPLHVRGRIMIPRDEITPTTVLNFDEYALRAFAAWMASETDAASPGQSAMYQGMFERKMSQLKVTEVEHPIELDPRMATGVDTWQEAP